ncbi:MAG: multiheme c-type cytochrome [Pirellulales bacterium]
MITTYRALWSTGILLACALVGCGPSGTTGTPKPAQTATRPSTNLPMAAASVDEPIVKGEIASAAAPPATTLPTTSASDAGDDQHADAAADPYAKTEKPKIDPVKRNGPIFEGWTKPDFALLVSGLQHGYLEPCGCTGIDNQKGGLSRRHALIGQLAAEGWPLVMLDVGDQVRRFGRQANIQFNITVDALRTMNYSAVGFGPDDLRLSTNELLGAVTNLADEAGVSRFVSANVGLLGLDSAITPRWRVVETAGHKLAITAVLGDSLRAELANNADIETKPAAEAVAEIMPELTAAGDIHILLAHTSLDEAQALARQFTEFDIVVVATGVDEPPREPTHVEGSDALLIDVGHKGMYVAALGFYADAEPHWRYQRVPLDSRFPNTPEMHQLMVAYQGQLQSEGFAGLELRPAPHPRAAHPGDPRAVFAGAATCQECHPTAHGIWSKTPHAHATDTLTKLDPPRQFDPECVSCHTTGWNAQEYYPYETGFLGLDSTPLLAGNGCENCHGPAAAHVAAEQATGADRDPAQRAALRAALKLTSATVEQTCLKCHDEDNSVDFDFKRYWPKVEHKGKK